VTIKPGEPWGRQVPVPDGLVVADSDRAVVAALRSDSGSPVQVVGGDLARTLGASVVACPSTRATRNELPIDLVEVVLDGRDPVVACAHVVARSPWYRGHWWRGPILAVMNVEFIGDWDIAPRGHPNDGRVEAFEVAPTMAVRARAAARRRLRSATHLPHRDITTRSVRCQQWVFPSALDVAIDGHPVGRASSIGVTVIPDAAVIYA